MQNKLLSLLLLLSILPASAGNLFNRPMKIEQPEITITLSTSLNEVINHKLLQKAIIQINSLRTGIPRILEIKSGGALENSLQSKIARSIELTLLSEKINIEQVFIAYEPGERYSLGNSVGRVFATNSGLILLNDLRLKQVAGNPPLEIYFVNLIIHELLHVYGIDHATGMHSRVRNQSIMHLGKTRSIGLSHDDVAALRENYDIASRNRVSVTIKANGNWVELINRKKTARSQSKKLRNNTATFPQLKKGKYIVYVDGVKQKKIKVRRNKVITLQGYLEG